MGRDLNPLPKVVFSSTLSTVQGNARLASGGLAEEIDRLRTEPGEGAIAIGGAALAAEAAALGLIDEYRARVYPVLVGGGSPFFPSAGAGSISNSSIAAPSAPESSTSAIAWRARPSGLSRSRQQTKLGQHGELVDDMPAFVQRRTTGLPSATTSPGLRWADGRREAGPGDF